jgi:hypothetical protein
MATDEYAIKRLRASGRRRYLLSPYETTPVHVWGPFEAAAARWIGSTNRRTCEHALLAESLVEVDPDDDPRVLQRGEVEIGDDRQLAVCYECAEQRTDLVHPTACEVCGKDDRPLKGRATILVDDRGLTANAPGGKRGTLTRIDFVAWVCGRCWPWASR